jgi:hypothetical protein
MRKFQASAWLISSTRVAVFSQPSKVFEMNDREKGFNKLAENRQSQAGKW